jgi:hypothetical protein
MLFHKPQKMEIGPKPMKNGHFFNKVMSYLAEMNKGNQNLLVENGWLSVEDEKRILQILVELGCIEYKGEDIKISKKGIKIILQHKIGKIEDRYNENTTQLLISK